VLIDVLDERVAIEECFHIPLIAAADFFIGNFYEDRTCFCFKLFIIFLYFPHFGTHLNISLQSFSDCIELDADGFNPLQLIFLILFFLLLFLVHFLLHILNFLLVLNKINIFSFHYILQFTIILLFFHFDFCFLLFAFL
jgi:hypothetical protein